MNTLLMIFGGYQLLKWTFKAISIFLIDRSGNSGCYESPNRDDMLPIRIKREHLQQ
jgi:hypothetical protein